ncbi:MULTISPECIES: hypothetical protein [unclassified Thioalkalivibrio]|uniref:hypothetical protein n=1 Tax=unclassified Thioalkalivibrio TaxID=2621013 RepID=UPI0012DE1A30|nr:MULTISPECIES: hypothetical protein [unclassified Thioalkalivibrio]
MSARIIAIKESGDISNERVVARVKGSIDIGTYVLLATKYEGDSVTNEVESAYWFPDKEVSEGDLVVLYTKSGGDKSRKNKNGSRTHFFYWGKDKAVWGRSDRAAVLIQSRSWQGFTPEDF